MPANYSSTESDAKYPMSFFVFCDSEAIVCEGADNEERREEAGIHDGVLSLMLRKESVHAKFTATPHFSSSADALFFSTTMYIWAARWAPATAPRTNGRRNSSGTSG